MKKVGADGKVIWVVDHEYIARCQLKINALTAKPQVIHDTTATAPAPEGQIAAAIGRMALPLV